MEKTPLIAADKNWGQEIIAFPMDWAPEMSLQGYEELRFAPQRSNPEHEQFWSLLMAWKVDATAPLSIEIIEQNFYHYFDALMKPNHWAQDFPAPTLSFQTIETNHYTGRIQLFDGFYTGTVITLNLEGSQHFCTVQEKTIVLFRISPQSFESDIWQTMRSFSLHPNACSP